MSRICQRCDAPAVSGYGVCERHMGESCYCRAASSVILPGETYCNCVSPKCKVSIEQCDFCGETFGTADIFCRDANSAKQCLADRKSIGAEHGGITEQ